MATSFLKKEQQYALCSNDNTESNKLNLFNFVINLSATTTRESGKFNSHRPIELCVAKKHDNVTFLPDIYAIKQKHFDPPMTGRTAELLAINEALIGKIFTLQNKYERLEQDNLHLHQRQKKLVESEKLSSLGSLVVGLAHEINTPLGVSYTGISGLLDNLQNIKLQVDTNSLSKLSLNENLDSSVHMGTLVVNNLERMVRLINAFKEIDTTQNAEYSNYFSVNDYLQDTIWTLNKKLATNNIEVVCNINEKIDIYGDHRQFSQLLSSLLINSIIHGFAHKDSGHINITFKKEGDNLLMTYRDNGQGMSNEQIKKLYDPFYSTQLGQGTSGLGMYIVYNIINQGFKGSIKCESELAKGVVFEIALPMIPILAGVSTNETK